MLGSVFFLDMHNLEYYFQSITCKTLSIRGQCCRHTYGVLTKFGRSIWLDIGLALFSACLWTETESRSINKQEKLKSMDKHAAILTEPAWWIYCLVYGIKNTQKCPRLSKAQRIKPRGQDEIAPLCLLEYQMKAQDLIHMARSQT